jgi:hypothetical protein
MLVRFRGRKEIDRLDLSPLFAQTDIGTRAIAVIQRWQPDYAADFKASERDDFQDVVARRPVVKIMNFRDYDHDGRSSEFYLKTDTAPCGRSVGVIIGISRSNPKLHAFGTVSQPDTALVLQKHIWEALADAASEPGAVVDWPCDDHGSPHETTVTLRWSRRGIYGFRRSFGCPRNSQDAPLSEDPL